MGPPRASMRIGRIEFVDPFAYPAPAPVRGIIIADPCGCRPPAVHVFRSLDGPCVCGEKR